MICCCKKVRIINSDQVDSCVRYYFKERFIPKQNYSFKKKKKNLQKKKFAIIQAVFHNLFDLAYGRACFIIN